MLEFYIGGAIVSVIIYYLIIAFLIIGFHRIKEDKNNQTPPVSVVVAARNEEKNLVNCLKALLAQTYPKELTQVVVVDDRSSDRTPEILNKFKSQFPDMQTVQILNTPANISSKKYALQEGISKSTGELIFTTDADCLPSPEWLSGTVPLFNEDVGLVMGFAPLEGQNNLWGKLLCLDSLAVAFVSAGATGWNVGVTCTGRNLAYRRCLFDEVNGFETIKHSLSGDDDLFLQSVKKHTQWEIAFSLNPRTVVSSQAPENFSAFISQKRRHVSAGKYYSKPLQIAYLLFNLTNLYLFTFFVLAIFNQKYLILASLLLGFKLILDLFSLFLVVKTIKKQRILFVFPLWEVFYLLNQTLIAPLGFMGKIKWK